MVGGGEFIGGSSSGTPSQIVGPNGSIVTGAAGTNITDNTSSGPNAGIRVTENGANGISVLDNGVGGITVQSINGPIVLSGTTLQAVIPAADPHVVGALYSVAGVVHVSAG